MNNILVIGATGFTGNQLTKDLVISNYRVISLAKQTSSKESFAQIHGAE